MKTKQNIFLVLATISLLFPVLTYAVAPTVLTQNATAITYNSAVLNGEVLDNGRYEQGYYNTSVVWFEYGLTTAYGSATQARTIEGKTSFSQGLSGLSQCATYHFRAVAQNPSEKAFGADRVFTTLCQTQAKVSVLAKNITAGQTNYQSQITAKEGDILSFEIIVESTGLAVAKNIQVKNVLPNNIVYNNNLKISGIADGRNITTDALALGDLAPQETKTITFEAKIGLAANLPTGQNRLINTAMVYTTEAAQSNSCVVLVQGSGAGIAGANSGQGSPTAVNTGIATEIMFSFLLPLLVAFGLVFLFRSQIIGFDELAAERKTKVDNFRAKRKLLKFVKVRTKN